MADASLLGYRRYETSHKLARLKHPQNKVTILEYGKKKAEEARLNAEKLLTQAQDSLKVVKAKVWEDQKLEDKIIALAIVEGERDRAARNKKDLDE